MITPEERREAAIRAAERGFRVFRLPPGSKDPYAKSNHHGGFGDLDRCVPKSQLWDVREEWTDIDGDPRDCNIAIDTTKGFVVLDIDCKNSSTGQADLEAAEAKYGPLPVGYQVRTPSGGLHRPFRTRTAKLIGQQKVFGKGIDIRAHKGYVLAEGSSFSCKAYSGDYVGENTDMEIPFLPEAWETALETAQEVAESQVPLAPMDEPANIDSAAEALRGLSMPPTGNRNNMVAVAAGVVKDWAISEGLCFDLIMEHFNTGLSEGEVKKTVRSMYKQSQNQPGVATAEHHFGDALVEFEKLGLPVPAPPAGELQAAVKGKSYWFDEQPLIVNIPWLVDDAIPEQSVGFLAAKPSMGKTFLAVDLALCTAFGLPFFGHKIEKRGGVHIIAAEGGYSIQARISAALNSKFRDLAIAASLDPARVPVSYDKQAPNLLTKEGLVAFIEQLREDDRKMREHYGVPLSLVIVDTFGQTFTLKDENAAADVSRATRAMRHIASALRVTVLSTHHYGKDEKADMRGSSALRANADFVLAVKAAGEIRLDKCRDAAEGLLGHFNMPIVEVGTKPNGDPITSRYISTRDMSEWPDEVLIGEPNRSEEVFEQSVAAMLDAKSVVEAPNGEGAPCRMVRFEDVRQEFYRRWGKTPAVNRQAFHRVRAELPAGYLCDKWDGCEWLWKPPAAES